MQDCVMIWLHFGIFNVASRSKPDQIIIWLHLFIFVGLISDHNLIGLGSGIRVNFRQILARSDSFPARAVLDDARFCQLRARSGSNDGANLGKAFISELCIFAKQTIYFYCLQMLCLLALWIEFKC